MTFGSLFSGAGGFDIGFDHAGFRCAWQCEIDKTARSVLSRHWPDVPQHQDVRAVGKSNLATVDVLVGGFPCQDVSTAGKRAGFEGGERSSLWYEMLRIVDELRPAFVVWENVPGLLSADDGRAFGWVLRGLADLGFDGGWRTVDAQFFGVPQQRRRVFGVFARGHSGAERAAEILALTEGVRRRTPKGRKAGQGVAGTLAPGAHPGGFNGQDAYTGHLVYGGGQGGDARRVAAALSAKGGTGRIDFDTENFVLIQDGRDVSKEQNGCGVKVDGVSYTLDTLGAQAVLAPSGVGCQAPDATPKGRTDGLAYALTARKERGHGRGVAVAFNWQSGGDCRLNVSPLADALSVGQTPAVMAFAENSRDEVRESDLAPCLQQPGGRPGHGYPAARIGTVVRRLMPVECERLMGWDDDWTRYRADGSEIADGPRYRMCGNGVVGTVAEWLARRLKEAAS